MAELPDVTPDYFEILVVRELRKAGLEVTEPRVHRRTELAEPSGGFYSNCWCGSDATHGRSAA